MDYTTLPILPDAGLMPESIALASLYETLQQLPDPRRGQGKRYELALTEPSRLHTPQGKADHAHLAIDGKTLRATTSQPHPVHQLSCYEVATGIVLWHCNVQEKENEISALKPLLTPQLIKERIFTLDAMHTQRALCAQVHRFEGDYLLIAKDNQPTLHEDIADLFEDRTPDCRRGSKPRRGTKAMGGSNTVTSPAVLISMTGLPNIGRASSRSFGLNARHAS